MARLKDGAKHGRRTFYFDRNRRNELRNAAKQAGQKPQEKQHSKDNPARESHLDNLHNGVSFYAAKAA